MTTAALGSIPGSGVLGSGMTTSLLCVTLLHVVSLLDKQSFDLNKGGDVHMKMAGVALLPAGTEEQSDWRWFFTLISDEFLPR